jgi:predicted metal-binding membrane protein
MRVPRQRRRVPHGPRRRPHGPRVVVARRDQQVPLTELRTSEHVASNPVSTRATIVLFVAAPATVAWVILWWIGASPTGRYFRHQQLADSRSFVPLVLVGWIVMIAAMMLPTTASLVSQFLRTVSDHAEPRRLVAALLAGYAVVWTIIGGAAMVGDSLLHMALSSTGANRGTDPWIAAAVLAVAGVYQFTAPKRRFRATCHSPSGFVSAHWPGNDPRWDAFRLGSAHGWFCVGCCWTLMLTMFALGIGNVLWMLPVAAVMGVEKTMATARFLSPLVGVALLGGAVVAVVAR